MKKEGLFIIKIELINLYNIYKINIFFNYRNILFLQKKFQKIIFIKIIIEENFFNFFTKNKNFYINFYSSFNV